uniref:LysR family transcriptional regulator n=1 Tax=Rhodococcus qingshengii TaxID=334542 RepID=UPI001C4E03B4|nr:LysR family transcriptional regulator [Rhodococcus qingshengii]
MELRHLRYFIATADAGSVNAASARVHVAQPSLSRQLRQLERDLGVELFDRAGNRFTLSPAGRALLGDARALIRQAEQFTASADYYGRGGLRRLSIAAPTVTLTDAVAPFVATLADTDPTIDVIPSDGFELEGMIAGGADIMIASHPPGEPFESAHLATLPVLAYVKSDHEWAHCATVSVEEVASQQLIVLMPGTAAREALRSAINPQTATVRPPIEAANGTIAQALAAAGRGIAVVSDDPRFDLHPLTIRVEDKTLTIQLTASWNRNHAGASTLSDIVRRLREFIAERYAITS